ncbi:unnamed protein product [Brassica rapa subsp. trilocularis]
MEFNLERLTNLDRRLGCEIQRFGYKVSRVIWVGVKSIGKSLKFSVAPFYGVC